MKPPVNVGLNATVVFVAVKKHGGKKPAARALGVCLSTIRYWMDRVQLELPLDAGGSSSNGSSKGSSPPQ